MIVAVSRVAAPNVRQKSASINGDHKAEEVQSVVFNRLGWNPAVVKAGARGVFWAYHQKAV